MSSRGLTVISSLGRSSLKRDEHLFVVKLLDASCQVRRGDPLLIAIATGSSPSFLLCDFDFVLRFETCNTLTTLIVSGGMTVET